MAPDVNAFVMDHKQAFEYFNGSIEVDSVAMCDVLIVLHVVWSLMVMANQSLVLLLFWSLSFLWFVSS